MNRASLLWRLPAASTALLARLATQGAENTLAQLRSTSSEQPRSAFKWSGVVLLVAGLAASVVVWRAQDQVEKERKAAQAADPSLPLAPLDSGKHVRDVEIYYGKLGVLMEKADDLLQGKSLAKTIAVVSTLTAASLFFLAGRRPA